MGSGYKIRWTEHALFELAEIVDYLEKRWTEKELNRFATELEHTIELISKNPYLFAVSKEKPDVRRAVILKLNSLYYRINGTTVELLSLFLNRKDPNKKRI